jgi:DNA excision repair protein ERCC-2
MQRVLQAVGRLIRSEDDQGAALLVDRRFLEPKYENLFPTWWRVIPVSA